MIIKKFLSVKLAILLVLTATYDFAYAHPGRTASDG